MGGCGTGRPHSGPSPSSSKMAEEHMHAFLRAIGVSEGLYTKLIEMRLTLEQ